MIGVLQSYVDYVYNVGVLQKILLCVTKYLLALIISKQNQRYILEYELWLLIGNGKADKKNYFFS